MKAKYGNPDLSSSFNPSKLVHTH